MGYQKNFKKFVATAVIIAIIFQGSIFIHSQQEDEIGIQFKDAIEAYISGQYDSSKMRLERVISNIQAKRLEVEKKDILGKCYLLMGAISEKKGETLLAEENYRRAKEEYGVEAIVSVNLDDLPIYRRVVKGEIDIDTPFRKAIEEYNNGQYDNSKSRFELVIGTIKEKRLEVEKKEILGKCYLLLGAISEKKGETVLAEEKYRNAKKLGIESIEGVDLDGLPIYERVVKVEIYIETQFQKAVDEYNNGQYDSSKSTLEQTIGTINKEGLEVKRKDILGKCYLLIGAIYEKKGEKILAEENYRRIIRDYGIIKIDGIDLDKLPIYKKIRKEGTIEEQIGPGRKRRKPFTELLIVKVVGIVSLVTAFFLLSKKEPKKKDSGSQSPENIVFKTNLEENKEGKGLLEVPEGGIATFKVWLSALPSSEISVSLSLIADDRKSDIHIQSNLNFIFTTSKWNQDQAETVTIDAKEDLYTSDVKSTIRISAIDMTAKDIIVTEKDNDK